MMNQMGRAAMQVTMRANNRDVDIVTAHCSRGRAALPGTRLRHRFRRSEPRRVLLTARLLLLLFHLQADHRCLRPGSEGHGVGRRMLLRLPCHAGSPQSSARGNGRSHVTGRGRMRHLSRWSCLSQRALTSPDHEFVRGGVGGAPSLGFWSRFSREQVRSGRAEGGCVRWASPCEFAERRAERPSTLKHNVSKSTKSATLESLPRVLPLAVPA